jgi:hypothetical protein
MRTKLNHPSSSTAALATRAANGLVHLRPGAAVSAIHLIHGASFDPETTAIMGSAYEKATSGCTDADAREVIARRIIEAARRGERDIERLAAYGLQGLGGTADAS